MYTLCYFKVNYILEREPESLEERDINWYTPLLFAADSGNYKTVQLLIDKYGANIKVFNKWKNNCLHLAASGNHLNVAKTVLNCDGPVKSIINAFDHNSLTPLHTAAGNGHVQMVELLLGNSLCDSKARSDSFGTALDIAVSFEKKDMMNILVKHGLQRTIIVSSPPTPATDNKTFSKEGFAKVTRPKTALSRQPSMAKSTKPIHQKSRRQVPAKRQNVRASLTSKSTFSFEQADQIPRGLEIMLRFEIEKLRQEIISNIKDERARLLKRIELIEEKQKTCCNQDTVREVSSEIEAIRKDIQKSKFNKQNPDLSTTFFHGRACLPAIQSTSQTKTDTESMYIYFNNHLYHK